MCLSQLGFSMMQPKPKKLTPPSTIDGQWWLPICSSGAAAQIGDTSNHCGAGLGVATQDVQTPYIALPYMTLRDTRSEYIYIYIYKQTHLHHLHGQIDTWIPKYRDR